jgi:hypothetical protein
MTIHVVSRFSYARRGLEGHYFLLCNVCVHSGQMTRRWDCPGWAGPVAGITHTSPMYAQYR